MTSNPAMLISIFLAIATKALAGKVVPCAIGSGDDNGCSYCDDSLAVDTAAWNQATRQESFDMATAASKTGGGYDVWWNIEQPDPSCRVIITEPYNTDRGSINSQLSGNVILSVAHGGCYFAHVGSRGFSAGFCCGSGDCAKAGASPILKRDLPAPVSIREPDQKKTNYQAKRIVQRRREGVSRFEKRAWSNSNPYAKPESTAAKFQCTKPVANGDTYTKSGVQQISGQTLNCNGGESCSISPMMTVSASTSLSNEDSFTHTEGAGVSVSMTAGFMYIGPTATVTAGYNKDWSDAVTTATGTSTTDTVTKSLSLSVGLVPGPNFNLWFTPTLRCQSYKMTCNGQDQKVEKCTPVLDSDGRPSGSHGIITVA